MSILIKANRYIAIILIIISAFLFQKTFNWPSAPAMLPRLILTIIIVLSILLFARSKIRKGVSETNIFEGVSVLRIFFTIITTILYIIFANILGFYFSTYLFLLIMFFYYGMKKIHCFIVPFLIILVLFFIFDYWLRVPTPDGLFI